MANPEYKDPTQPKEVGQVRSEPKEVEIPSPDAADASGADVSGADVSGADVSDDTDTSEQTLDEFTKGIDGSKFSSFDDLLEYIVLLNELPDTKKDMESSRYDLRNTRFMRALTIYIEYLNAHNWFAIWEDGEVFPLDIEGVSKDKKVKFDPKTKRAAFNQEWFTKLYDATLKFFTAAPGLSEDFIPQTGISKGKVTKTGNRTKYIKQHLGQIGRIAQKRGEEKSFIKMVSWLHNIYLAGSGSGTSRFEYQDPYKYLYDSEIREAEGFYIYETKEEAIASLIGVDVSPKAMRQIMGNHKKSVWMGLTEGYNDLPSELDPREDPQSGYGKVDVNPETKLIDWAITAADLPPRAKMAHYDLTSVNKFLDSQACENCGCNPCACDIQTDEDMAMGNTEFFNDEVDECLTDVQPNLEVNGEEELPMEELLSKKTTEIKGSENESSKLNKTSPKLKGGVKKEGGTAGLEGGKKPAAKPPASV